MKNIGTFKNNYFYLLVLLSFFEIYKHLNRLFFYSYSHYSTKVENIILLIYILIVYIFYILNFKYKLLFVNIFIIVQILKYSYGIIFALLYNEIYYSRFSNIFLIQASIILCIYIILLFNRKKLNLKR